MYDYRELSLKQQAEVVHYRKTQRRPFHSPPHWEYEGQRQFIITSACYEHAPIIGENLQRMTDTETELLAICGELSNTIYAWCILPNHYHILLRTDTITKLRQELGKFHGRTSFHWNKAESKQGRKVWFNCIERAIKSNRHFWASVNYIHHNPVKHGYVKRWQDWAWSSAEEYLEKLGTDRAAKIWREFPILNYGQGWDDE